ncbi:hypothetical protein [Achromobacter ruhlandii]|uniref:hypothetical protein n=1 Tax=Achromobacter ruhlandii TaxID=72557 RepID=UPI002016A4B0|nr:hypothetical protein [Achromobacter ruhlandii]
MSRREFDLDSSRATLQFLGLGARLDDGLRKFRVRLQDASALTFGLLRLFEPGHGLCPTDHRLASAVDDPAQVIAQPFPALDKGIGVPSSQKRRLRGIVLRVRLIFPGMDARGILPPEAVHERATIGLRSHARGQEAPGGIAQDVAGQALVITIRMRAASGRIGGYGLDARQFQRNVLHRAVVGGGHNDGEPAQVSVQRSIVAPEFTQFLCRPPGKGLPSQPRKVRRARSDNRRHHIA